MTRVRSTYSYILGQDFAEQVREIGREILRSSSDLRERVNIG